MMAMTVVDQGAERKPGDHRHDDIMVVMCDCGVTRHRHRKQAGRGHKLQFVYALLNHWYLRHSW
jgi:hypothetical protein